VICLAYALAMSLTLVYTGEHYVSDVLLGWLYAGATYLGVTWVRRLLAGRRERSAGTGREAEDPGGIIRAA
jgi:membrane-associated phospholipid phosphatase